MPDGDSELLGPRVTERGFDRLVAANQRNIEKRLCAEADRDRLREAIRDIGAALDDAAETAEDPELTVDRLTELVLKAQSDA